MYLLHYVELFIKDAPIHFNLIASQGFPYCVSSLFVLLIFDIV
jgi:hypothetical protein